MTTIRELLREFVISLGDPKPPVKLMLGDFWDSVFPSADTNTLLAKSLAKSISKLSNSNEIGWSENELTVLLDTFAGDSTTLDALDSTRLAGTIRRALQAADADLLGGRSLDKYDNDQLTSNLVGAAVREFSEALRAPENRSLRTDLLAVHVTDSKRGVDNLRKGLDQYVARVDTLALELNEVRLLIDRLRIEKEDVRQMKTALSKNNRQFPKANLLTKTERDTLKIELPNYELSLSSFRQKWSYCLSFSEIPVRERRDYEAIRAHVRRIRRQLGLGPGIWGIKF